MNATNLRIPRMPRFGGRVATEFGYVRSCDGTYSAYHKSGALIGHYSHKIDAFMPVISEAAEARIAIVDALGADPATISDINRWDDETLREWMTTI